MPIRSYRDLVVWQKAMDLVVDCYRVSTSFPDSERYGLTSQLQHAAVSIPANFAEGRARGHLKEFIKHLGIACGSQAELETHIEIAFRLKYVDAHSQTRLNQRLAEIGRMLTALRTSLRRRLNENK